MGVTGLWKFAKDKKLCQQVLASSLSGETVAVDAFCMLYESWAIAVQRQLDNAIIKEVIIEDVEPIWFAMLFQGVVKFLSNNIIPIMVADGDRDVLKTHELETRGKARANIKKQAEDLRGDPEQESKMIKLLAQSTTMPAETKNKAISMFKAMGLPWVQSLGEAERTCALMNRDGVVRGAYTPDGDAALCGAKVIIKEKCSVMIGRVKHEGYVILNTDDLLSTVGMDFNMFQEMCIMMGTDFNPQFKKGFGWVHGATLLKKCGSIEGINKECGHEIAHLNVDEVKQRFKIVPWTETAKDYDLNFRKPDIAALVELGVVVTENFHTCVKNVYKL